MASGEINRILRDFEFVYQDGTGADELWQPYFDFAFDTSSSVPNSAPILSKLTGGSVRTGAALLAPVPAWRACSMCLPRTGRGAGCGSGASG